MGNISKWKSFLSSFRKAVVPFTSQGKGIKKHRPGLPGRSFHMLCILGLVLGACTASPATVPTGTPALAGATEENFPGVIGWEADKDGVIASYDGSFYVRDGRNERFQFGIFNNPASLKWYNNEGYLPCLVTEFERDGATVRISNFGDQVTLNGNDYAVIYSRVAITNHNPDSLSLDPAPSAGLKPRPMHGPHADSRIRAPAAISAASDPFSASIVSTWRLPGAMPNSTSGWTVRPLSTAAAIVRS